MNSVLDAILKRRSVRSYQPTPVPKEMIKAVIEAGNEAPSAMNSQPWRFVVVEDGGAKRKLLGVSLPNARKILELVRESDPVRYEAIMNRLDDLPDPVYYSAPVIIFVIGSGRYSEHSCPLACENMMLAAHALGLGSCWVGFGSMVTEDEEVRAVLELKEDETIYGPILLGYPTVQPERPQKKEPLVKWV
ncbi:MAG: nitroreductase family protein [Nitrospirales bacterium]|nr:nitroreductase family protein [Nitrospirales bacterium]